MSVLNQLKIAKSKLIMHQLHTLKEKREFSKIVDLLLQTSDVSCIYEGIDYLYQKNQWDLFETLYMSPSPNQAIIRNYLLQQYEKEYKNLESGLAPYYIVSQPMKYKKRLDIMLFQTLSTKDTTPSFGNDLVDFFIAESSIYSLVKYTSLILNNYPEKKEKIKESLIMHKDLLQLNEVKSPDFFYLSYIFHHLDFIIGAFLNKESPIPFEYVLKLYYKIQSLVMQYNETKLNSYRVKWNIGVLASEESIENLVLEPHIPILSILDQLPIHESKKMETLFHIDCDESFKEEMISAFRNRKEHPEKLKYMDIYYVLYVDAFKEQLENPQKIQN